MKSYFKYTYGALEFDNFYSWYDYQKTITAIDVHQLRLQLPLLNNYQYKKNSSSNFEKTTIDCIKQLRDTHKYIRLWYSGGVDSHYLLRCWIKSGLPLDEIAISIADPFDGQCAYYPGYEPELTAIPWLQENQNKIKKIKSKVKIYKSQSKDYEKAFSDHNWFKKTSWHSYQYFNTLSFFNLHYNLDHGYNIGGSCIPYIWHDDVWKWCFLDRQLLCDFGNHANHEHIGSLTIEFPEFVEAMVNAYSKKADPVTQHEVLGNAHNRNLKYIIPEFQKASNDIKVQFPKGGRQLPAMDIIEKVNLGFKPWISLQTINSLKNKPKWWSMYLDNTDWDFVKFADASPAVFAKEFALQ